jgi:hypothetical protein
MLVTTINVSRYFSHASATRALTTENPLAPIRPMTDYSKRSLQSPRSQELERNATLLPPFSLFYIPSHAYAHEATETERLIFVLRAISHL